MNETNVGLSELPEGWVRTTLGEICESALKTQPKERPKVEFTYIDIASIDNHLSKVVNPKIYVGKDAPSRARQVVRTGDILFSTVRTYLKNIALVKDEYDGQIASTGFCIIRPLIASTEFIFWMTLSNGFLSPLNKIQRGTSYPAVRDSDVFSQIVPLPPENEQIRIVTKIEELFTKLDAGKEELLQAKARLKRYRQSVLKVAMEGKLTEDWRKKHGSDIEPAFVLLDRILKERREKWEAEQLEQMIVKGKTPKDDKWKNKYKEPQAPDTSKLSELPEGWVWASVGQVTHLVTKGSSPKWQGFSYVDTGILFLRSQNVVWRDINLSDIACLPKAFNQKQKKSILKKGDVLLNLVGASIGRAAIASDELEGANMNQAVALIRLVKDGLNNKLLMNYLLSPDTQSIIHGKKVDVARANLSLTDVSLLTVTLPPLPEQHRIVDEVERHLSVADAVEATIDDELKRSDALRQSILKQAFSGKLVSQNPNDEPAEKLLERIKKEKAKREAEQKTNSKIKKQFALFEH